VTQHGHRLQPKAGVEIRLFLFIGIYELHSGRQIGVIPQDLLERHNFEGLTDLSPPVPEFESGPTLLTRPKQIYDLALFTHRCPPPSMFGAGLLRNHAYRNNPDPNNTNRPHTEGGCLGSCE
jgi:hypothetical protein